MIPVMTPRLAAAVCGRRRSDGDGSLTSSRAPPDRRPARPVRRQDRRATARALGSSTPTTRPLAAACVAAADVDRDGYADLITAPWPAAAAHFGRHRREQPSAFASIRVSSRLGGSLRRARRRSIAVGGDEQRRVVRIAGWAPDNRAPAPPASTRSRRRSPAAVSVGASTIGAQRPDIATFFGANPQRRLRFYRHARAGLRPCGHCAARDHSDQRAGGARPRQQEGESQLFTFWLLSCFWLPGSAKLPAVAGLRGLPGATPRP
jgi:hypothetical protein